MEEGNREIIDHMDMNSAHHLQEEISKINQSVLRSIHYVENGTLHFITLPPREQEFIDSTLLGTELLTNHTQNGLLVDFISAHTNNGQYPQQTNMIDHHSIQTYTTEDLQNLVVDGTGASSDSDRKLLLQLVHKQQNQINNEAQVIVTNAKEMATITPLHEHNKHTNHSQNHINLTASNTYLQYHDQTLNNQPQQLQTQQHQSLLQNTEGPIKIYHNQISTQNCLSHPPLTPIKRVTSPKIFTNIHHNNDNLIKDELEFDSRTDDDELVDDSDCVNEHGQQSIPLPRKNLPHKKRISKKLGDQIKSQLNQMQRLQSQRNSVISNDKRAHTEDEAMPQIVNMFACQLCGINFEDQLQFFTHLKAHYEPIDADKNGTDSNNDKKKPKLPRVKHTKKVKEDSQNGGTTVELSEVANQSSNMFVRSIDDNNLDQLLNQDVVTTNNETEQIDNENTGEFSETEDMLEGIRNVVQKVQETVDTDTNDGIDDVEKNWYQDQNEIAKSIGFDGADLGAQEIHINTGNENFILFLNKNDFHESDILDNTPISIQHPNNHQQQSYSEGSTNIQQSLNDEESIPILSFSATEIENNHHIHEIDKLVSFNLDANHSNPHLDDLSASKLFKDDQRNEESDVNSDDDDQKDIDYNQNSGDDTDEEYVETLSKTDKGKNNKVEKGKKDDSQKKSKKFVCSEKDCDKTFNSKTAIRYHQLHHSGERPHQCDKCGKSFFTSSALKVHARLHSGERPYKCEVCDRTFRQWGDMKYHMTSIHSNEKSHQCEFCGKEFARRYSLVIHRRIHTGEKNYVCEFCKKSFRASSYLQNHRRIHTGEKPHKCPMCDKKFRCRGDMKRHVNTHSREKNGVKQSNLFEMNENGKSQNEIIDLTTIKAKTDDKCVVFFDQHIEIFRRSSEDEGGLNEKWQTP